MMKNVLRIIPFIGLIIVLFSAARILATPEEIRVEQKDGVAYADGVDLSEEMVFISYWYWEYYPEKLYEPADFADGLPEEPVYIQPGPNDTALYGTYRMRLKVPAGGVYAITGDSFLYAQRAYADGTLIGQMGDPRPTAEQTISQTGSYTYYFSPQSDETELIFQVANFVHPDGGSNRSFFLARAPVVERYTFTRLFYVFFMAGCLVAIFLFYLGVFLFFPKRRYYLWFALACILLALRILLTDDKVIMKFLPSLSWQFCIRTEYLIIICIVVCVLLFLRSLYPDRLKRRLAVGVAVPCIVYAVIVLVTEPRIFTAFNTCFYAIVGLAMVWAMILLLKGLRKARLEHILICAGIGAVFLGAVSDALFYTLRYHGYGFPAMLMTSMMVCIFLYMVSLSIQFNRTEEELLDARLKERELSEKNRLLDELSAMKTRFLADTSHELKTPLTVMSGYAQLSSRMLKKGQTEEVYDYLASIAKETGRLARLVNELLTIGRLQETRPQAPVMVGPILTGTAGLYETMVVKQGNRLQTEIDDDLPPVLGDPDRLVQLFVNLLSNANTHTHGGSIQIKAYRDGGCIRCSVTDTGEGIDPSVLPHVFDRYRSGEQESSGLGLSICREIVEAYGGEIGIESEPGKGTTVWFTLPAAEEENANEG